MAERELSSAEITRMATETLTNALLFAQGIRRVPEARPRWWQLRRLVRYWWHGPQMVAMYDAGWSERVQGPDTIHVRKPPRYGEE